MEAVEEFATGPLQLGEEVAMDYLNAARETLDHPNAVTDQAFGGWVQYRDALELGVSKALAKRSLAPGCPWTRSRPPSTKSANAWAASSIRPKLYARTLGK